MKEPKNPPLNEDDYLTIDQLTTNTKKINPKRPDYNEESDRKQHNPHIPPKTIGPYSRMSYIDHLFTKQQQINKRLKSASNHKRPKRNKYTRQKFNTLRYLYD